MWTSFYVMDLLFCATDEVYMVTSLGTSFIRKCLLLGPYRRPMPPCPGPELCSGMPQGLLQNKVHHAVGAWNRLMPKGLGSPTEQCGTLFSSNPCI